MAEAERGTIRPAKGAAAHLADAERVYRSGNPHGTLAEVQIAYACHERYQQPIPFSLTIQPYQELYGLACEVLRHEAFTAATVERLKQWLAARGVVNPIAEPIVCVIEQLRAERSASTGTAGQPESTVQPDPEPFAAAVVEKLTSTVTVTKKAKRGAQQKYDAKEDERIVHAWGTGQHSSYKDLAEALGDGWTAKKVRLAIDRHRDRQKPKRRK